MKNLIKDKALNKCNCRLISLKHKLKEYQTGNTIKVLDSDTIEKCILSTENELLLWKYIKTKIEVEN